MKCFKIKKKRLWRDFLAIFEAATKTENLED